MSSFKALVSDRQNGKLTTQLKSIKSSELPCFSDGDVLIKAHYSSLNYKDALGVTGKGKIFKSFPIVGGIDVSGEVLESSSPQFKPGDLVLVTGTGMGEEFWGGYSEQLRVPAKSVVLIPKGLSPKDAMIIGTAGFTAALCFWRFQQNGQTPDMGPILVTGASGGVGSFAVHLFSEKGFEVIAASGRPEHYSYLTKLGAKSCIAPENLGLGPRPLESVKFGGVVDNVGGNLLAAVCRHVQLWGNVGSIGLAGGVEFTSTVMPHILRGVSILGISSNNCQHSVRLQIWKNFTTEWKVSELYKIHTQFIKLDEVVSYAEKLLNRELFGRVLVEY